MDAVFNFHYIYVLAILVIMAYVLVRLLTIAVAGASENIPSPGTGKAANLASLLKEAAGEAAISLELEDGTEAEIVVNENAFRSALISGFQAFGTKTHGKAVPVRSGKRNMVHLVLTVNRKAGAMQEKLDEAVSALLQSLKPGTGAVWQADVPRKTELHVLIPGN